MHYCQKEQRTVWIKIKWHKSKHFGLKPVALIQNSITVIWSQVCIYQGFYKRFEHHSANQNLELKQLYNLPPCDSVHEILCGYATDMHGTAANVHWT